MRDEYNSAKSGTKVYVKGNDVTKALRKLKKMMQSEKIFQEVKDREAFVKPSLKRKRARASAIKRWQKALAQKASKD
jgi:small subunit ribosomal protein S21